MNILISRLKSPDSLFPLVISVLLPLFIGMVFFKLKYPVLIPLGLISLVFLMVVFLNPFLGVFSLVITSLMTQYSFEFLAFTIRPDQITTAILSIYLLLNVFMRKMKIYRSPLDIPILLYLGCNFVSSLLNSKSMMMSLQRCLLLAITIGSFFIAYNFLCNVRYIKKSIDIFIYSTFLVAIYGIFSVILLFKGIDIGGAYRDYEGVMFAKGTISEGNAFGAITLVASILVMVYLTSEHIKINRFFLIILFITFFWGIILSNTRAVWLSLPVGIIFYFIVVSKRSFTSSLGVLFKILLLLIFFMLIFVLLVDVIPSLRIFISTNVMTKKMMRILDFTTGTGYARLVQAKFSLAMWKLSPILGHGTDSVKYLYYSPFGESEPWISNPFLLTMLDTGLVGLLFFSLIIYFFVISLYKILKTTIPGYIRTNIEGFLAGFISIIFAYQSTSGFWSIFIWVYMGIGMALFQTAKEGVKNGIETPALN